MNRPSGEKVTSVCSPGPNVRRVRVRSTLGEDIVGGGAERRVHQTAAAATLASTTSAATSHVRRRVGVGGETDPLDTVVPGAGCSISTAGELPERRCVCTSSRSTCGSQSLLPRY
jgi:hypothetical protein